MPPVPAFPRLRIATVGPPAERPCGILDYRRRLDAALATRCDLVPLSYAESLSHPAAAASAALLIHYERSLVPYPGFLKSLSRRHPGKVLVIPHEVYREDPFAFPYASLSASSAPLLWLKRIRYRWRHRDYGRETALQAAAYHAHRVVPMSREGAAILRERAHESAAAGRILAPVPHARFDPSSPPGSPSATPLFEKRPRKVAGIFGFLNPGLDYAEALDLLESLGPDLGLALLGGVRAESRLLSKLELAIQVRGLVDQVRISGWIPEALVKARLLECDFFLGPMRFKSNSGSLLQLFGLGRPILVPDLPLTRFLKEEGAPLDLYANGDELVRMARGIMAGNRVAAEDRYPWTLDKVAEAYLDVVQSADWAQ